MFTPCLTTLRQLHNYFNSCTKQNEKLGCVTPIVYCVLTMDGVFLQLLYLKHFYECQKGERVYYSILFGCTYRK